MSKIKLWARPNPEHNRWMFFCPGCQDVHQINHTWQFNGDFERPTITPSILVTWVGGDDKMRCHSYVTDGQIQFLADSTHALAGKTVPLPDWRPVAGVDL